MNQRSTAARTVRKNVKFLFGLITLCLLLVVAFTDVNADPVIESFAIPENSSGLAWDGEYVWIGGLGEQGNWIRAFDPDIGQIVDSIRAPVQDCIGLAWIGDRLAYLSPRSNITYFVTREGSVPAFENPIDNLGGLASQGANLWSATYSQRNGTLLYLSPKGEILLSLPFSGRHSRDMAFHRGRVWVADRLAQSIREVNPESGRFIRSIETPAINPDGLTSDGEFLWASDDGEDHEVDVLYKILTMPDGNIRISELSHNFGSVVIDDEADYDFWIYNDGAREARLMDFQARNGNEDVFRAHVWRFPERIAAGDSALLRITFTPAWEDSVHIEYGVQYDVDDEIYWIDLRGNGIHQERDIVLPQRALDFGMTRCGDLVNGSNLRYLLIENNGGEPLTVDEIEYSHDSFFHGYYDFPHTFETPGLYRVPVFFRPSRDVDTSYNESLIVHSDDPDSPRIRINLEGRSILNNYQGGEILWDVIVGNRDEDIPRARAIEGIDDVTGDGLADVVIASNDYLIQAFHAASSQSAIPIWVYRTNRNPWRSGLVAGPRGMSSGDDWDGDGVRDIAIGLEGGAMSVIAISGRTGAEIWKFDTHGMRGSGGHIKVARGEVDYNNDGVNDVMAISTTVNEQHTTDAVFVLNGLNGEVIWNQLLDFHPVDAWALDDFNGDDIKDIVILSTEGDVAGIDGNRGRVVWESEVVGLVESMFPLLGDANGDGSQDIGFVTHEEGIYVLNGSNGVQLWNNRTYDDLLAGIPVTDVNGNGSPDIVYGDDFLVRAIDGLTGTAAWDTSVYIGSATASMETLMDFDGDQRLDYLVGTSSGRLYAFSGNGHDGLWSYSNVDQGHAFVMSRGVPDIDGNGEMDILGAMENGRVFCFSGSYVGNENWVPRSELQMPAAFSIDAAYPNPFNSHVILPVKLNESSRLTVNVYNILGQQVFKNQTLPLVTGNHKLHWNGMNLQGYPVASGVYLIEVQSKSHKATRSVELLR